MNRNRRRNTDEVTVEIKDSENSETRYWNLRGEKEYNYQQTDSEKALKDEIDIKFNLDENRKLTEQQKQTILNTLLQETKEPDREEKPSNRQILIAALTLAIIGLAFLIANTGC